MAQVLDKPATPVAGSTKPFSPVAPEPAQSHIEQFGDIEEHGILSWPPSTGVVISLVFVVILGLIATFIYRNLVTSAPATHTAVASSAAAGGSATGTPALSATEIKEAADRDAYTVTIAKELHTKVPAYKNVQIFADNWAGEKSPTRTPQIDAKTRKGDNLMLVFLSPEPGTAKGLSDFAKSKAAQEAANAGFAELQFVDPNTYCYTQIAVVGGVAPVKCGPR